MEEQSNLTATMRGALVNLENNLVEEMLAVGPTVPPGPPGKVIIHQDDWAEGQIANRGDIWNGDMPATFFTPPPVETEKTPLELVQEANALTMQAMLLLGEATTKLGG